MSTHPPDWQLSMYAEESLDEPERPALEAHLVGCQECRRRVVAFEDEARLLRQMLQGEVPQADVVGAPAQGFTWGLPLALLLVAGLGSAVTAILDFRVPGAAWLGPSSLLGVNEMVFDVLFAIRDDAPGWLEFGLAVAALAGLGTLGAFASGALLRRVGGAAMLAIPLLLVVPATPAQAALDWRFDQDVRIGADEVVEGTLVVSGDSLVIDGVVHGDVICFSENVSVRGRIEGNLIGGGRDLELDGTVTGSVAFGSERSRIDGEIEASAYLAGDNVTLAESARVGRDLYGAAGRLVLEGVVGRDVTGTGDHVELRGRVARDVDLWGRRATVAGSAEIGGALAARLESEDALDWSDGATIGGARRVEAIETPVPNPLARYGEGHFYLWILVGFVASFLVGLGLHAVFPRLFGGEVHDARAFFVSLGIGAAVAVAVPIGLVLVAITLVGIPAALIGLALFGIALYIAKIAVAALIGRSMLGEGDGSLRSFGLALLAGLALVAVLSNLPFLGGMVSLIIRLVGLGLLADRARRLWRERQRSVL